MIKRIVLNVILGCVAITAIVWLYFQIGLGVIIPALLLLVLVIAPLTMRHGKDLVLRERTAVLNQVAEDKPIEYDRKKVRRGFLMMLMFLWIAPAVTTMLPGGTLWIAVFIPVFLVCLLCEVAISKTWRDFNYSTARYWLMNIGITSGLSALLFSVRILIGYT